LQCIAQKHNRAFIEHYSAMQRVGGTVLMRERLCAELLELVDGGAQHLLHRECCMLRCNVACSGAAVLHVACCNCNGMLRFARCRLSAPAHTHARVCARVCVQESVAQPAWRRRPTRSAAPACHHRPRRLPRRSVRAQTNHSTQSPSTGHEFRRRCGRIRSADVGRVPECDGLCMQDGTSAANASISRQTSAKAVASRCTPTCERCHRLQASVWRLPMPIQRGHICTATGLARVNPGTGFTPATSAIGPGPRPRHGI
jgi:hypothetical protein